MWRRTYIRMRLLCLALLMLTAPVRSQTIPSGSKFGNAQATVTQRLSSDGLKVSRWAERGDGVLTVIGRTIHYSEDRNPGQNLDLPCDEVDSITVDPRSPDAILVNGGWLGSRENGLKGAAIYQGIRDACNAQKADYEKLLEEARRPEEDARKASLRALEAEIELSRQRAASEAARRKVEFREGILTALHAAEELDPFASIRGDFDLSGSDNRQWKTSLLLPGAEKCGLIKTPSPTPNIASAWTLACTFHSFHDGDYVGPLSDGLGPHSDGYERIVKSVQGVLGFPYQPDERETKVNQVFFADPNRPRWRLYVTKISEANVGIAVVAVSSAASASPMFPSTTPFSAAPAVLPTEPTVRDEIEKIRLGKHGAMPPAQRAETGAPAGSGRTTMTVKNSTAYELSVFFDGPVSTKLTLAPGGSQEVELAAGGFHIAGRVAAANVLPFYGEESYAGSARYSMNFYITP
jgi:hypothetical protein